MLVESLFVLVSILPNCHNCITLMHGLTCEIDLKTLIGLLWKRVILLRTTGIYDENTGGEI